MMTLSNFAPEQTVRREFLFGRRLRGRLAIFACLAAALFWLAPAQSEPRPFTPSFWDPHARPAKPDLSSLRSLRFLTDDDYPPFHFALPDGSLAGFNVDLARAICEDLKRSCTIQARRFDTLFDSLDSGDGDAVIASLRVDPGNRARGDFTAPYARMPARFVALKTTPLRDATPELLRAQRVGVIAKTAHEAFLAAYFDGAVIRAFPTQKELTAALLAGDVDAAFADAAAMSLWLNGAEGRGCCGFVGGAFLDSFFFGDGVGIAVRKGDTLLRQALDYALADLAAKGAYTELYLKYFPLGLY